MGNRLTAGFGRRLDDFDDRVHGHAAGRIEHERAALRDVAAHLDQPPRVSRVSARDQARGAAAQRLRLRRRTRLAARGDLQQVADDHLVVGRARRGVRRSPARRLRARARRASPLRRSHRTPSPRAPGRSTAPRRASRPCPPAPPVGASSTSSRRSNVSGCRRRCGQPAARPPKRGRAAAPGPASPTARAARCRFRRSRRRATC